MKYKEYDNVTVRAIKSIEITGLEKQINEISKYYDIIDLNFSSSSFSVAQLMEYSALLVIKPKEIK